VLEVKNMPCLSCAATVKKSLKRLNGVEEIRVTLDPPEAVVIFDSTKIGVEDLIRATTNAGYPSAVKRKN
jgi:mercuric ion binding protein